MRPADFTEKRRTKRLDLVFPAKIKVNDEEGSNDKPLEGITLNVSFNGAYIINIDINNIKAEGTVNVSLSVPRDDTRDFPFSRIVGKAKVVRLEQDGVALDFDEDISRLFVAN